MAYFTKLGWDVGVGCVDVFVRVVGGCMVNINVCVWVG